MRLPLSVIAAAAPDKGAAMAALATLVADRRREAEHTAAMAEAEHAAMAARLAVEAEWRAIHGAPLERHWHAVCQWDAAWCIARGLGDARDTMGPRPIRPDMIAPAGWVGTVGPAVADSSFIPAAGPRAKDVGRWQVGQGQEWTGSDGGTVVAPIIRERKGARDDREADSLADVAYEWRLGDEPTDRPYRAAAVDASRWQRSEAEWREEVDRVRALHGLPPLP